MNAAVLLADGFEETEAITTIDVLRRAGIEVEVLGVDGKRAVGAHRIAVEAEELLAHRETVHFDLVVLPGGMPGAARLRDAVHVQRFLAVQYEKGGRVAAIGAAPIALAAAGLLNGRHATCYPGFEEALAAGGADVDRGCDTVTDGRLVTSRGPGTAMSFARVLVETLCGEPKVAEEMLVRR